MSLCDALYNIYWTARPLWFAPIQPKTSNNICDAHICIAIVNANRQFLFDFYLFADKKKLLLGLSCGIVTNKWWKCHENAIKNYEEVELEHFLMIFSHFFLRINRWWLTFANINHETKVMYARFQPKKLLEFQCWFKQSAKYWEALLNYLKIEKILRWAKQESCVGFWNENTI